MSDIVEQQAKYSLVLWMEERNVFVMGGSIDYENRHRLKPISTNVSLRVGQALSHDIRCHVPRYKAMKHSCTRWFFFFWSKVYGTRHSPLCPCSSRISRQKIQPVSTQLSLTASRGSSFDAIHATATRRSLVVVEASWNVMAHAQKPDFVFRRNGLVHLNRRGHQFSRLLADEVCASAVIMLDTSCSEVVWRVLATHSVRQFPLHFPSRASPCAITFQLESSIVHARNCAFHLFS